MNLFMTLIFNSLWAEPEQDSGYPILYHDESPSDEFYGRKKAKIGRAEAKNWMLAYLRLIFDRSSVTPTTR